MHPGTDILVGNDRTYCDIYVRLVHPGTNILLGIDRTYLHEKAVAAAAGLLKRGSYKGLW